MATTSKTKANGTNWAAAKAYYLALPRHRRTKRAVAKRFGVSDARVGQVARLEHWDRDADSVDERTERRTTTLLVRSRAEREARYLEIVDLAADLTIELFERDQPGPTLEQMLKRMPGLAKIERLVAGEATDRVDIADVQPVLIAFARIAVVHARPEARRDVVQALEAVSSGLVQLDA